MPSPFPGMDPFLETSKLFPGFYSRFINSMAAKLELILPPGYFADINERLWVEMSNRTIEPDATIHHKDGGRERVPASESTGAGIALMTKPVVIKVASEPQKEDFLEIYQLNDPEPKLVCAIELLSLANKTSGSKRQSLYLLKQEEILNSKTHLLEVDLLRAGNHTTAVPLELAKEKAGNFDYHACSHRFDIPDEYFFYPIQLDQRLPRIGVPLLPGTPEVILDLQQVFERAYEDGPYRRRIDYVADKPVPPLPSDREEWMKKLFKEKGIVP